MYDSKNVIYLATTVRLVLYHVTRAEIGDELTATANHEM
jgi:hypothetical protein